MGLRNKTELRRKTWIKRSAKRLSRESRLERRPIKKGGRGRRYVESGKPDEAFREWIRRQRCIVTGRLGCEACHVRTRGAGHGDRRNLVPMVPEMHRRQHQIGVKSFAAKYGLDLSALAVALDERYMREVKHASA